MKTTDDRFSGLLERAKAADGPSKSRTARIGRSIAMSAAASTVTLGVTAAEASLAGSAVAGGPLAVLAAGKLGIVLSVAVGLASGAGLLVLAGPFPGDSKARAPAVTSASAPAAGEMAKTAPSLQLPAIETREIVAVAAIPVRSVALPSSLPKSSIAEETHLLAQVQEALRTGNGQGALVILGRYRRDFGKGALVEEATASEVFAHCALGNVEAASRARARFLRQFAGSPLQPRVERACASDAGNKPLP